MLARSRYLVITKDVIIPLVVLLSVAVGFWLIFNSSFFRIKEIVCNADYKPCENGNVLVEVEKSKGQNLFRYQESTLVQKLEKGDFMIKTVTVKKILPNKLVIETESVNPSVAFVVEASYDSYVLCDRKGRVIAVKNTNPNVPTITVPTLPVVRIGEVIEGDRYAKAQQLALTLRDTAIDYTTLALLDDTTLGLKLKSGVTALITTNKSIDEQLAALQAILSDATIKKESYKTIDVRFAQAILRQN